MNKIELRDYQKSIVNKCRKLLSEDKKTSVCVVLPCGSGKSVIAADIAYRATNNSKRVLFIVHRKELCDQINKTFTKYGVNMNLCKISMIQTITRHLNEELEPDLILTDEAHHCCSKSYVNLYNHFNNSYHIGFTATPERLDGKGLGNVYNKLLDDIKIDYLIENNYLSNYTLYSIKSFDINNIKVVRGDYDLKQITDEYLNSRVIFGDVIKHYKRLADNKKAICFCPTIKISQEMEKIFNDNNINAKHFDSKTSKKERTQIIDDFRNNKIKVLINVELISEGFDVPDCEVCILLRPTKSYTLYIQQAMRCMRYKEGKNPIIIDHAANYLTHGLPDDYHEWDLNPKKKRKNKENNILNTKICPKCFSVIKVSNLICNNCKYIFTNNNYAKNKDYETNNNVNLIPISKKINYDISDSSNIRQLKIFLDIARTYKLSKNTIIRRIYQRRLISFECLDYIRNFFGWKRQWIFWFATYHRIKFIGRTDFIIKGYRKR